MSEMVREIDNKHSIAIDEDGYPFLAKRTVDGKIIPIPENEPTILFRARDKLAVPMLKYYRQLCMEDGCTDFQMSSMDDMISKFEKFSQQSATMKQPGCTKGL